MYELLKSLSDSVGMAGVIIILVAYFLLSIGRWSASSFSYQLVNFIGAWLILYSLYFNWNLSSVVIEIAWAIISLIGIYRALRFKNQSRARTEPRA